MKISLVSDKGLEEVKRFLRPNERKCVPLIFRMDEKKSEVYVLRDESDKICGVIVFSRFGHLLPYFSNLSSLSEKQKNQIMLALAEFCNLLGDRKLFCIVGERKSAEFMESAVLSGLSKHPMNFVHYNLMEKTQPSVFCTKKELEAAKNVEIVVGTLEMRSEIFELQKAYELEEVIVQGAVFDEDASRILLNQALSKGLVYLLKADGKIVSKLTVNAKSDNYVQFGGIFTRPEFRGNRFAKILLDYVAGKYINSGKKISLFVKKSNEPAKKLYARCGFEQIGEFKICYY